MKNTEVTKDNWEKYQTELGGLYGKLPTEAKETVGRIVLLELELQNISDT